MKDLMSRFGVMWAISLTQRGETTNITGCFSMVKMGKRVWVRLYDNLKQTSKTYVKCICLTVGSSVCMPLHQQVLKMRGSSGVPCIRRSRPFGWCRVAPPAVSAQKSNPKHFVTFDGRSWHHPHSFTNPCHFPFFTQQWANKDKAALFHCKRLCPFYCVSCFNAAAAKYQRRIIVHSTPLRRAGMGGSAYQEC